jgi:hypothetical protein
MSDAEIKERSPHLKPCNFYLQRHLKNKVYSNNSHILKHNVCETITSIEVSELAPKYFLNILEVELVRKFPMTSSGIKLKTFQLVV